ncbi:MAG: membrane protein insertase YidC [Treponema sp.]|jgi:YidC/Oxa1 family membrane protein insertase|nr:membrane protein insertase YidC [Treponema sp.]
MDFVISLIAYPLGWIMRLCYGLTQNYGAAIILFTLLTKIILLPIALAAQKNSVKMVKLKPRLDEVKARYKGDKERMAEEQIKIYESEKYSPALGCLPLFLQIPIIVGLVNVIYNPLTHLLGLDAGVIDALLAKTAEILGAGDLGVAAHIKIIESVANPANLPQWQTVYGAGTAGTLGALEKIHALRLVFLGLDLTQTPTLLPAGRALAIPMLAAASAFALCMAQNKANVLQREQGAVSQWLMTAFLVGFSWYFTFSVPAGVGLYWIFSSLFGIAQLYMLNALYDPRKHIDYSAVRARTHEDEDEEREAFIARKKKENKRREDADYRRFFAAENKRLVFYSEKSGFYKYFENVIAYVVRNSDIVIHYVTSDPDDAIFRRNEPNIAPYYIGDLKLIPFMMKMDADMVVMTMPDLEQLHIKRSRVRKDVEYVYMFHGPLSFINTIRHGALDYYDTIFCAGKFHVLEVRESEKFYNLPAKRLVECGYGVIENMREHYLAHYELYNNKPMRRVLIAPSWNYDNILDSCLDELLPALLHKGWQIILRPHPDYIKRFGEKWGAITAKYEKETGDDFIIEVDFSSNETVYSADVLVSDWSWIAYEFSLAVDKPVLFINTDAKMPNPHWDKLPLKPLNMTLRSEIGVQLEKNEMGKAECAVKELLSKTSDYTEKIQKIREEYIYNFGKSGEMGGRYIIERLRGGK